MPRHKMKLHMLQDANWSPLLLDAFGRLHLSRYYGKPMESVAGKDHYQHLYITTAISKESPIKIDEWYIDDTDAIRQAVTDDPDYWEARSDYRRIIGSTDPKLKLPGVSEKFMMMFCRARAIEDVWVTYPDTDDEEKHGIPVNEYTLLPVIREDNTLEVCVPTKDLPDGYLEEE